ncbi:choice-of-anchor D domain-containing protein [bacterium]|nr:choice-of-anchor D domain-containing protein [bacterium]
MKLRALMAALVAAVVFAFPSSTNAFSGSGLGTVGDPYVITDVGQLQEMSDDLAAAYELGNHIDATATLGWNGGGGFDCVGSTATPFTGSLDGQDYIITGLWIDWPTSETVGLIGSVDAAAAISNVRIVGAAVTGEQYVGILAGVNAGTITNCDTAGAATGEQSVGGLIGGNALNVQDCHSDAVVIATLESAGGLVGLNSMGGTIQECYSNGLVSAPVNAGGFAAINMPFATIMNCYSLATVSGEVGAGGFVGSSWYFGTVGACYSAGYVTGNALVGGFEGYTVGGTASSCFWDMESSGQPTSSSGTGMTTAEMKQQATFDPPWDFSTVWSIHENRSYPFFYEGSPTQDIDVQPSNAMFGNVPINQGAATREIFIFNQGSVNLTIASVVLTGDSEFSISSDTGDALLAPSTARAIEISFDPDSLGDRSALLTIVSNDLDEAIKTISISGTGYNTAPIAAEYAANSAVALDGDNESVSLAANAALQISGDITLEAWVYPNTISEPTQHIINWGGPGSGEGDNYLYAMRIRDTGDIGVYHENGGVAGADVILDFETNIPVDQWTHVAVVRDATAMTYEAFVNGVSAGTLSYTDPPTGGDVGVAAAHIGANAALSNVFNGLIDEVRVWDAQRTGPQIAADMYHELNGDESNLVGYWQLNEADITKVTPDLTGNGNDGTLEGEAYIYSPSEAMGVNSEVAATTSEDADTTVTLFGFDADGDTLAAVITQLPNAGEGRLYQLAAPGPVRGAEITAIETALTDSGMRFVYAPENRTSDYESIVRWKVDDGFVESTNATTCTLSVIADGDAPVLVADSLTIDEGGLETLGTVNLEATGDWAVSFRVDTLPQFGTLRRNAVALNVTDSFTQQDVSDGLLEYEHDSSDTTADDFDFSYQDADSGWIGGNTFTITVNPVNDPPVLTTNNPLSCERGGSAVITDSYLAAIDDNPADEVIYTVTAFPVHGSLTVDGTELLPRRAPDTFTQADINAGLVSYTNDGAGLDPDSFEFGCDSGSGSPISATFNITVNVPASVDDWRILQAE